MTTVPAVFQTASIVSLVLFLKYFATNLRWGLLKGKAGLRAKEDFNNSSSGTEEDVAKATDAGRIVQNDLENIPFGIIFMWSCALCLYGAAAKGRDVEGSCRTAMIFSIMFGVARVGHSIVYILKLGSLRSAMFGIGMSGLIGLAILSVINAFEMSA
mmetsp:Transcript_50694/g.94699  ORF Transcript_50694/g.94699 Transcript_50694/m.94699 type:complete len:157 (+) Transcript_50694:67-537(+)